MRFVFLDFDGVLNSWRYFKDAHTNGVTLAQPHQQIDKKAVRWLNEIVEPSGAKVVISSTWRVLHTMEELKSWLSGKGFRGEVVDRTPEIRRGMERVERGEEIAAWIDMRSDVDSFVILDDGQDMKPHMDRLVWVDARKGLKPKHVEAALEILAGTPKAANDEPTPSTEEKASETVILDPGLKSMSDAKR